MLRPLAIALLALAALAPAASAGNGSEVDITMLSRVVGSSGVYTAPCGTRIIYFTHDTLALLLHKQAENATLKRLVISRLSLLGGKVWLASVNGAPGNYTVTVIMTYGSTRDDARRAAAILEPLQDKGVRRIHIIIDNIGLTLTRLTPSQAASLAKQLKGLPPAISSSLGLATVNGVPFILVLNNTLGSSPDLLLGTALSEAGLCNMTIAVINVEKKISLDYEKAGASASLAGPGKFTPLPLEIMTGIPKSRSARLFGPERYVPGLLLLAAAIVAGMFGAKALS